MIKASDLFTLICDMLDRNGYNSWKKIWGSYSNLVMLEGTIQKTDIANLKQEISIAHKWVEGNACIPRRTRQEMLSLLGFSGRVLRLSNISKVNEQATEDVAAVIARYHTLIGPAKVAVASRAAASSPRSTRPVGSPPKSKKSSYVRAAAPNRAAKSTRKGSSGKTLASGKLRS